MTDDVFAAEIDALLSAHESDSVVDRLFSLPDPAAGNGPEEWNRAVGRRLETILAERMRAAIDADANRPAA